MKGARPAFARWARLGACALLALAGVLAPAAAQAQTRSRETAAAPARAVVLSALSFINTRDMEFGRIAATAGGTVTVGAATGLCAASAGVLRIGACQPAEFTGRGALNMVVRLRVVETAINLTGPGAPMRLDAFAVDAGTSLLLLGSPGNPRYRIQTPSGIFTFRVGGRLRINPNQAPGVYAGTFSVRADYQ